MPTSLKPTQPVYFNLNYEEDREFWNDIHSNRIPNFTKWVKAQWILWKQQQGYEQGNLNIIYERPVKTKEVIKHIEIEPIAQDQDNVDKTEFESTLPKLEPIIETSKKINPTSLTKMFGIKTG